MGPGFRWPTVNSKEDIATLNPNLLGHRTLTDLSDPSGVYRFGETCKREHEKKQEYGKNQIEEGATENNTETLPHRFVGKRMVPVFGADIFALMFTMHFDVPAKGKSTDKVFGIPPFPADQLGAKAKGEFKHPDAKGFRKQKMAQLMNKNKYAEDNCERKNGIHADSMEEYRKKQRGIDRRSLL
jgi:hypothetical protein